MKRNGLAWLHIQVELLSGEQSFFPRAIAELKEAQVPQFVLRARSAFLARSNAVVIQFSSPGFQVPGLERRVETRAHVPGLPGHRLDPVAFLPGAWLGTEIDGRRTVGVLFQSWKGGIETGADLIGL